MLYSTYYIYSVFSGLQAGFQAHDIATFLYKIFICMRNILYINLNSGHLPGSWYTLKMYAMHTQSLSCTCLIYYLRSLSTTQGRGIHYVNEICIVMHKMRLCGDG